MCLLLEKACHGKRPPRFYITIKDGRKFVGDASIVPAMDKFCSQRNQVIHEDVLPNVATIRQHALTCSKVLLLLHDIYPM